MFMQIFLIFLIGLCPIVFVLAPSSIFNMYLGKISTYSCIVFLSGLYAHFLIVLNSDEYQILEISMFLHS